jgi:hypothetical protein
MKVIEQNHRVKSRGVLAKKQSTLKTNAKAFRMLSDMLYSDAVEAVIRELSTNAVDAHVEVGTEKPFDIHLPTFLEPYFSIRDYGPGISPEKFESVYLVFFESDKTDSDDFIGTIGIGAKSPFSYTKSYNIISYVDGVKRSYVYFKNEEDIPELDLLSEDYTDEPNGLEVSFAVKQVDFNRFEDRARKVYRWFSLRPKTNITLHFESEAYDFEGDNFGLSYEYSGSILAIMGNIAYPIDKSQFTKVEYKPLLDNTRCHLWFNIGELDFTPSREGLHYNKHTVRSIEHRLIEILNKYKTELMTRVEEAENLFEARKIFLKISRCLRNVANSLNINYQGLSVSERSFTLKESTIRHLELNRNDNYSVKKTWSIYLKEKSTFYIADEIIRLRDRLLPLAAEEDIYVVEDNEEHRELITRIGLDFDLLPRVSSLPKPPPRPQSERKPYVKGWIYSTRGKRISRSTYVNWQDHSFDFKDGGIYVNLFRYRSPYDYDRCIKILSCLDETVDVIGLRPAYHKRAEESDQWIDLKDYALIKLKKELPKIQYDYIQCRAVDHIEHFVELLQVLDGEKLPKDLQLLLKEIRRIEALPLDFHKLVSILKEDELKIENLENQVSKYDEIVEKYRLLTFLCEDDINEYKEHVLGYINSIGAQ